MHDENKRRQLISEWCHRTRSRIEGHKTLRKVRPLFWGEHITLESELTATASIVTDEVQALQVQVEEIELAKLIDDQEKLRQLMRIPEVREAIMYYTLNGYLKDF